jgi:hypothetical protein
MDVMLRGARVPVNPGAGQTVASASGQRLVPGRWPSDQAIRSAPPALARR